MLKDISIENAHLLFKNFSGAETAFNPKGRRNFCVGLSVDQAEVLTKDGWNVKFLKPRSEEDDGLHYIQVSLRYDNYPPNIFIIQNGKRKLLSDETIGMLDWAEIAKVS